MLTSFARWVLALGLGVMGVAHFTQTRGFRVVVPDWATKLSGLNKDAIVIASGLAELALSVGLLALPQQRATMGRLVAAFFVAVFPGNLHQFQTGRPTPGLDTPHKRLARLFLQPVLVAWALWCTADRRTSGLRR